LKSAKRGKNYIGESLFGGKIKVDVLVVVLLVLILLAVTGHLKL